MKKNDDLMLPNASPGTLNQNGVRRVNNLPLILVIAAFALFVLIIAFVAMKRANQQHPTKQDTIPVEHHMDSSLMAAEIVAGRAGGIIMPAQPIEKVNTSLALPVALVDNPDNPPVIRNKPPILRPKTSRSGELTDPDLDRIKMAKMEQFEDAVKAKMSIPLPDQLSTASTFKTQHAGDDAQSKLAALKRQMELLNSGDPTASYQARLQQIRAAMGGHEGDAGMHLIQNPSQNSGDLSDRWELHSTVEAPRTPFVLRAGAVIPGIMISGVKPDLPGQIIGQVSQNVYDTATGKYLLFPQGTRLIGMYSNEVSYGQSSVLIAWQRLIFPDGKALDIGSMPGGDSAGFAGFHDQVNNHYVRLFGSALLMSGVVAGITYSQNPTQTGAFGQPAQPTAGSVMSAALGQELGQVTSQMIAKNLNIAPSLTIRPGYEFNVIVVKDMTFTKPYQSFDY
ncbi:TPA: TrbI/VirB10 family protein [Legionella pneumophila]|nr:conjugal transfer protein TrbI [Legionella pneumophila]HAU9810076.1 conjugal transfer protein TrbI [Legionella pneumophila]HAU9905611.1 conjugal transfer protein TrbI [Legionella pneumophila]HAU9927057.1 conjugal transfer protein TrbI [Legionella pneumophila]HAU9930803.1 conjugal transfer protein TrbI [Legionella pneumophila]